MMRIPAAIGLMSAALVFFNTGEQQSERPHERATAAAGQKIATVQFIARREREIAAEQARRTAKFVQARNAEISASMAAVEKARSLASFAEARNAEIEASMSAVEKRRIVEFVAARNAEIAASIAAVNNQRAFAAARNAESEASLAAVEARRMKEFAAARNSEIAGSLIAVASHRAFAAARNAEATASLAAVEAQRTAEFAEARNAEIDVAMAAYQAQQAQALAKAHIGRPASIDQDWDIETSSIEKEAGRDTTSLSATGMATPGARACGDLLRDVGPIHWTRAETQFDESSTRRLDQVAAIANRCTSMVIEIHGHSDGAGSAPANRDLSARRARAVAAYLVRAGIAPQRLVAIGHGAEAPILPESSEVSSACNRRIEFTIGAETKGPKLSDLLQSLR